MKLKASFELLLALCLTSASALAAPSAREILAQTRAQQSRQDVKLEGQLRNPQNNLIIPFHLTLAGPVIRYSFSDPEESLQLRLGESDSQLEVLKSEGIDKITGPEFEKKIRGTAISYEDIALRFLYWPGAEVVGDDYIHTRRVWKLDLKPPGHQSQYSHVFLWCEQKSGAMLRMEGYDWNGKLIKRFDVVSVQDIEGRTFLKQMRIDNVQPETGKAQTMTYLEINK